MSLLYKDTNGDILDISGGAISTQYIADQLELSDYEEITISTSSDNPTTFDYDGEIILNTQCFVTSATTRYSVDIYLNGKALKSVDSVYQPVSNSITAHILTFSVKKGDTIYVTLASSTNMFAAYGRWFKKRDYSNRS